MSVSFFLKKIRWQHYCMNYLVQYLILNNDDQKYFVVSGNGTVFAK